MNRFFAICLLSCVALLPARGEGDTLNSIYHSLSRFGNDVRNTFAEDSGDQPSPTPRRHRKSATKHLASKKTADSDSDSDSANASPTAKAGASKEASKSKPASEASTEAKQDGSQPAVDEKKSASNPSSTPSTDEGTHSDTHGNSEPAAPMATLKPEALREFSEQPAAVQALIRNSLALTEKNLSYKYGSADPAAGGMDCSGFIYYALSNAGYKDVPRDSAGQYVWVRQKGDFHAVLSRSGESFELGNLNPGDLMFWSGTYKVDRDIPITHVMIYLGKEKASGKPVMVGATDGRSYDGVRRFGVSVFDFKMPSGQPNKDDPDLTARFEGYASVPGLRNVDVASKNQVNRDQEIKSENQTPNVKAKPTPQTLGNGD
jgi:cell wall-associated NlpC family hydrolase